MFDARQVQQAEIQLRGQRDPLGQVIRDIEVAVVVAAIVMALFWVGRKVAAKVRAIQAARQAAQS